MKRTVGALCAALWMVTMTTQPAVKTEEKTYKAGETEMRGMLAYDDAQPGKRPGVIVVHEWYGLNDYAKQRARQLAELGYVAFAVDMYGGAKTTTNPREAGQWAGALKKDIPAMRERAKAALATLAADSHVDPQKPAAIGYCFGGTVVLEMARAGMDVKGVVSFHGGLEATTGTETRKPIQAKVLALCGADDPHAPMSQVQAFADEMRSAGADYEIVLYGGAVHSFTNPASGNNPSKGIAYNAAADRRSWENMQLFFKEIFSAP